VTFRIHPGIKALKGALASSKGKDLSFAQIRVAAQLQPNESATGKNEPARLIDTNLIIRYLVQDHARHAKAAGKLFDACGSRRDDAGRYCSVVVAEVRFCSGIVLQTA